MQYDKTYLIYFSPTHTSAKAATSIAEAMQFGNITEIDLTYESLKEPLVLDNAVVVVAVPVYGGRVAETAVERLQMITAQDCLVVPVVLYGNRDYEDALLELADINVAHGFTPVAAAAFIGEHSYSTPEMPIAFDRPDVSDLAVADAFGREVRQKILSMISIEALPKLEVKGNYPYKVKGAPSPATPITVEALCTQCEYCIDICPTSAIALNDQSEIASDISLCIKCCACVKECPQEARLFDTPYTAMLFNKFKTRLEPELFL